MQNPETCYLCGSPAPLVTGARETVMGSRPITFEDEYYQCSNCGEKFYVGAMADESFRRAAAAVRKEDGLLVPDEIREIRARYGLSQANLEKLIGSGEKTVVRWERGTVAQNATADTLLRVLRDHPEVVAKLAERREVPVVLPEAARSAA
ncbi:MAG: type II TA system antitoxin MqsA family protein [Longimicrobiaceae bacterium]